MVGVVVVVSGGFSAFVVVEVSVVEEGFVITDTKGFSEVELVLVSGVSSEDVVVSGAVVVVVSDTVVVVAAAPPPVG